MKWNYLMTCGHTSNSEDKCPFDCPGVTKLHDYDSKGQLVPEPEEVEELDDLEELEELDDLEELESHLESELLKVLTPEEIEVLKKRLEDQS